MKKLLLPFFSCLLVFTLLLGLFGSARAEVGDDPVVTPVSGDMEFTTEIIPIASLPGIIELDDLMLAPAGFPAGEAQFEGAGVHVTGMDFGKASACFTISGTQYGWGGKVGMWNGTKWMLLPTTITSPEETPNSIACATITGNGTYAFIRYVVDASLLPAQVITDLPTCRSIGIRWDGHGLGGNGNYDPYWVELLNFNINYYPNLPNALIQYDIINSNVPLTGDLHGSAVSDVNGYALFSGFSWRYDGPPITSLVFTIHVVTPVCYDDFVYDWSWALPQPTTGT